MSLPTDRQKQVLDYIQSHIDMMVIHQLYMRFALILVCLERYLRLDTWTHWKKRLYQARFELQRHRTDNSDH